MRKAGEILFLSFQLGNFFYIILTSSEWYTTPLIKGVRIEENEVESLFPSWRDLNEEDGQCYSSAKHS